MDTIREKIIELLGLKKADIPDGSGLEGFTDEQLEAVVAKARESYAEARSARDVATAASLVEFVESVASEQSSRAEAATKVETELADLDAKMAATEPVASDDSDAAADDTASDDADSDADATDPSDDATDDSTTTDDAPVTVDTKPDLKVVAEPKKEAVAASADTTPAPSKPVSKPMPKPSAKPAGTATPKLAVLKASGDIEGHSAGSAMPIEALGPAFKQKSDSAIMGRVTGRLPVATIDWLDQYDQSRFLSSRDSIETNTEKINAMVASAQEETAKHLRQMLVTPDRDELEVLTAEGGLCAPVNVRYDIFTVGTEARPLRDSFVRFGATRGGIRFNAPPVLSDISVDLGANSAVNVYTEQEDTDGTSYPKGCQRIDCGADTEVAVSNIPLCMIVGNYDRLFFPENFQAWWGLGRVAHSREAEVTLWDRMETLSCAVTAIADDGLSATPDILSTFDRAIAQYRWRHRIAPETPLRGRTQAWIRDYLRADLARRMPGDSTLAVTNGELARYFAARNVAMTWILDANSPGGASGDVQACNAALNPWPDSVEFNLSVEGSFFFLDGGSLNFGTEIRDFDQIRDNDSAAFMETFEELALVGPQPLHITIDTCPSGIVAGQNDSYDPCTRQS